MTKVATCHLNAYSLAGGTCTRTNTRLLPMSMHQGDLIGGSGKPLESEGRMINEDEKKRKRNGTEGEELCM